MSKDSIQNRYDFVFFFDVKDGNPNGDPDAGNLPRIDAESGHGLVTDVCLKRKVRNYVGLAKSEEPPYEIYVKEKSVLNRQHERAYQAVELKHEPKKLPKDVESAKKVTDWMSKNFYDIRAFGAVMTTEVNCGQVRGPVQMTFARSIDPVISSEHAITRMAVTNERDLEKERTIGRKFTVPYALYRCHGYISASFAEQSGFSEEDLELFWEALSNMFEHDRSAARGQMAARKLVVFKHDSKLGNAPAHKLFDMVQAEAQTSPTREFSAYQINVPEQTMMPSGVTVQELL